MATKTHTKRKHRWSGAGYVCADCGAIKDTGTETKYCPGNGVDQLELAEAVAGLLAASHALAHANLRNPKRTKAPAARKRKAVDRLFLLFVARKATAAEHEVATTGMIDYYG